MGEKGCDEDYIEKEQCNNENGACGYSWKMKCGGKQGERRTGGGVEDDVCGGLTHERQGTKRKTQDEGG